MAPKIPSVISCSSIELLEHELDTVRSGFELTESEDTWEKINNALLRLNAVVVGSAVDYPSHVIAACKEFVRPIINSLNSDRSRLSGCATELMTNLATNLQRPFETLIPLFVPTLLDLASRSIKIFVARAKNCLLAIVEHCGSPVILPLLRHSVSDKSVTLRQTTIDVVVACLNSFNPPDLESKSRVEDIEAIIRATARDSNADVRKSSRTAFDAYKILFPGRLDAFIAPLTPTMKKYLNIKSANQRKPLPFSSSTSAPSVPSAAQSNDILSRSHAAPQGHSKSSSTSSATSSSTTFTRVERAAKSTKPASSEASSKQPSSKPPSSGIATDNELMPPPPAPPKSSSGPVRPPPGMRPAIPVTSAAAPSRPLPGRQASRMNLKPLNSTGMDITKSQPVTHGEVEHRKKSFTPAVRPGVADHAQPKPVEVEPFKKRSTGGPRRVPKPEGVVAPSNSARAASVPPPATQKPAESHCDDTKGKEKERPTSSSASSAATAQERKPVFMRPPEPVAPTEYKVDEKEKGRVKELIRDYEVPLHGEEECERQPRKRSESRSGEFRPSSRAENGHKRTTSREQEMHSRPASHMEGEVLQRPPSRAERPPSRIDGEVPFRPESRAGIKRPESRAEATEMKAEKTGERSAERPPSGTDGGTAFRPESRAGARRPESRGYQPEIKAMKTESKAVEEVNPQAQQSQLQKAVDPEAQARREERRRRRAQAEQAALEAQAQADTLAQARREEKRRRREQAAAAQTSVAQQQPVQADALVDPIVAARREEKRRRRELAAQQHALLQAQSQGEVAGDAAAAAKLDERRRRREEHEAARAAGKRPKDEGARREKPPKKRRNEANPAMQGELVEMQADARKAAKQLRLAAMSTERETDEKDKKAPARIDEVEDQSAPTIVQGCRSHDLAPSIDQPPEGRPDSTPPCNEEEVNGAALTAIDASHANGEESRAQEPGQFRNPAMLVSDAGVKPLAIYKAALETPLPPSPLEEAYVPRPFETPAPLRQAVASRCYQVPVTPISRLLDTIQRGFDPDFSTIGEESESDVVFSGGPPEAQSSGLETAFPKAPTNNTAAEETVGEGQTQAVFVDALPRKIKSSQGKEKEKERHAPGHAEGRPPLKAQNR